MRLPITEHCFPPLRLVGSVAPVASGSALLLAVEEEEEEEGEEAQLLERVINLPSGVPIYN